ncbi:MAG: hypothetical protein L7F77_09040 [Candidatus Magnetominusculus sp. LBB02]|nr:hypothetical protein [Candidatus Magnetominusculus sp. LBB02]
MSADTDDIFEVLSQTDHAILSKIINGGAAFLGESERSVYEEILRHAEQVGWSYERLMWALQRVMEQ